MGKSSFLFLLLFVHGIHANDIKKFIAEILKSPSKLLMNRRKSTNYFHSFFNRKLIENHRDIDFVMHLKIRFFGNFFFKLLYFQ